MSDALALIQARVSSRTGTAGRAGGDAGVDAQGMRVRGSARLTNFYPLYGGANDQVDPVLRVQPVQFQRVIPRYRLSTSETRDQGQGPMFADIPESPGTWPGAPAGNAQPVGRQAGAAAPLGEQSSARPVPEPWLGRTIDLYA